MRELKIIFSLLISIAIFYSVTSHLHQMEKEEVINRAAKSVESQYQLTLENINNLSYSYFKTIIDKDRIKKLFALREREILYYFLKDDYQILKDTGFKLVHFHLPDNRSFLRMDQPKKFGDDLSKSRSVVVDVNKKKIPVQAIETGYTQQDTAYRFVYPLWYKKEYLGSVEISFLLEAFLQNINLTQNYYSYAIINKRVYDPQSIKGKDYLRIEALNNEANNKFPVEDLDELPNNIDRLLEQQKAFSFELDPFHTHDIFLDDIESKHQHYIATYMPINNSQKQHMGYIVFYEQNMLLKDIEYKFFILNILGFVILVSIFWFIYREIKYSKKLESSNERLSVAAKASFDLLYEWDVKSDHLEWFGDIDSFLGFEQGEISNSIEAWLQLIHPDDVQVLSNAVEEHRTSTKPIFYEYRIRHHDGTYQHWKDKALPILDSNNKPVKWIGVCTDITTSKKAQKQLVEQSKLAAMGEMIGNIAHQWRQPLSVISTGATGIKMQKELNTLTDENFIKTCDSINDNAQYLSKTIDDFRDFIKGDRQEVKFNLDEDIRSFTHLVEGSIKNNNIQLIKDIDEEINIIGYPNELIQCFINIFNNAKDALKDIEGEKYLFISTDIQNKTVSITFKDNGGGIPDEVLSHVFEPYFTTKHKSQGTGLGLHMTYSLIVEGMNGNIEANNVTYEYNGKEYIGAEFKITLPLR